jgi:cysteine desulfurase / selenocysteine lyase
MSIKKDFPIFQNNPWLVFLDSTSTTQKPSYVIDWMKEYLENNYANIHRGRYSLAENSDRLYIESKKKVADFIEAKSWREIVYTMNSTYAANLLASSIWNSDILQKWDVILLSIVEHHANIVPWQILAKNTGADIQYVWVNTDYSLDMNDLTEKLQNPKLKIVSLTHVSNVTGEIFPLEEVGAIIPEWVNFFIDASQSVPHFQVDVQKLWCDALFFTGHKIMADSGIGVLYGKKEFLEWLNPGFSWGWAISWVHKDAFKTAPFPDKFEPGTPNLSGAVSILKALEYVENIWGHAAIQKIEQELLEYALEKFSQRPDVCLQWSRNKENRVWVFSFYHNSIHVNDIAEWFAEKNICVRSWQHCAEPLMIEQWIKWTCRMSLYIYNTKEDIDIFFQVLDEIIERLS